MLDGVYRRGTDGAPEFVEVPAPTDEALQAVLHKIITRTTQAAHPSGGVGRRGGFDLHGQQRRRFGRGPHAQAGSGRCRPRLASGQAPCQAQTVHWTVCVRARLLKRVFELDLEHCPNCGGELKIIAAILEQPVIEKILTHLGLQARAPPRSPARGQALQAA